MALAARPRLFLSLLLFVSLGVWNCGAWPASPAAALAGGGTTRTTVLPLELFIDPFAPQLLSATSENSSTVLLVFTESMETVTSQTAANYCVETTATESTTCAGTQLSVTAAAVDITNSAQVRITTAAQMGTNYRVTVNNAQDQRGNAISGVNWRYFDGTP